MTRDLNAFFYRCFTVLFSNPRLSITESCNFTFCKYIPCYCSAWFHKLRVMLKTQHISYGSEHADAGNGNVFKNSLNESHSCLWYHCHELRIRTLFNTDMWRSLRHSLDNDLWGCVHSKQKKRWNIWVLVAFHPHHHTLQAWWLKKSKQAFIYPPTLSSLWRAFGNPNRHWESFPELSIFCF